MEAHPKPKRRFDLRHWLALGLIFFSMVMSAVVSGRVFERLPHLEDEVAYLYQAKMFAGGNLVIDSPEPRRPFWQPFVLDYEGKRFGKYSPGWPALLAAGVWLGEPWVINMFFAGLTVALVYRLGSEIFNRDTGLIAAALTAFSPMALLLNGTLMGHTSALFGVVLFMYAYWRLERRPALRWGIAAGIALGMVVANRPLTGVAIAVPFVVWSGIRLLRSLRRGDNTFLPILRPLLAIAAVTVVLGASVPYYSYLATGEPTRNLYTLVWEYDTVGFGECCGRASARGEGGHDLERGVRHMRFDLSLTAADLYGWQLGAITPEIENQWLNEGDYFPNLGLSWILLPFGLIVAFRRNVVWIGLWLALGYAWLAFFMQYQGAALAAEATPSYIWMVVAFVWLVLPLFITGQTRARTRYTWSWLLIAVAIGLILVQLMYWIGSQRYSTRYYFEMLAPLSIISALPLAWLARKLSRRMGDYGARAVVYSLVLLALLLGFITYSIPRVSVLRGFNMVTREQIEQVEARREDDRPVLVLVTGSNVAWRAYGSLMAVTSPYLDSDIVAAWDYGGVRDQILARFPDRQVIEMQAEGNNAWFVDEGTAE